MRRRLAAAAVCGALLVTACGAGDDPTVDAGRRGGTATTAQLEGGSPSSTAPPDEAADRGAPFATTPASTPPRERGLLTKIRHASHPGYHRVVFEFSEGTPGYRVAYAERPIIQDGSGDEVTVEGASVLLVQFEPASAVDLQGENAVETYEGAKRITVESPPVVEIVKVSDFEAHLDWAVGVDADRPYRVFTLDGPPRVVLDVQR